MTAPPLTLRQMSVASLLAEGYTDKQIAATLEISIQRVGQLVGEIGVRMELDRDRDTRIQIATRFSSAA